MFLQLTINLSQCAVYFWTDHLYIRNNFLEVCKLNSCAESLLVLNATGIDFSMSGPSKINLVIDPVKRFVHGCCL